MDIKLRKDEKVRVLNGRSLYGIMLKILNRSSEIDQMKEHSWMVGLDPTHEILFIELLSLSKSESTTFDPIHIFNIAVHKSAVRVIMVHNSLTDEIASTESDMKLTEKMGAIGLFLNIPVWDHLIITKKTYYSFLDAGTLDHLIENSDMPDAMKEVIIKRNLEENNVALQNCA